MPKIFVHVTEDLLLDLESLYETNGESAGQVRDALVTAIRTLKNDKWDDSVIKPYGVSGTRFLFDFCSGYFFTFRIDTYRDESKHAIEQHYYLKNLFRKK